MQPWGTDSDKRRYYLIEGLDDTHFRVYRESNPANLNRTWWSVAGSIDELKALADKLETKDGGPKARRLAQKIMSAIPRFEATEEVSPFQFFASSAMHTHSDIYVTETPATRVSSGAKESL